MKNELPLKAEFEKLWKVGKFDHVTGNLCEFLYVVARVQCMSGGLIHLQNYWVRSHCARSNLASARQNPTTQLHLWRVWKRSGRWGRSKHRKLETHNRNAKSGETKHGTKPLQYEVIKIGSKSSLAPGQRYFEKHHAEAMERTHVQDPAEGFEANGQ